MKLSSKYRTRRIEVCGQHMQRPDNARNRHAITLLRRWRNDKTDKQEQTETLDAIAEGLELEVDNE